MFYNDVNITFATTMKPFTGIAKPLQINCINSLMNLSCNKRVLIYTEFVDDIKTYFEPYLDKIDIVEPIRFTESNGVYLKDIFDVLHEKTEEGATLCYINSDMIMMDDFVETVDIILNKNNYKEDPYFICGRRWEWNGTKDFEVLHDFSDKKTVELFVEEKIKPYGKYGKISSSDFFVHNRGLYHGLVPDDMVQGRGVWGAWLANKANELANTFDIFKTCFSIHPEHNLVFKHDKDTYTKILKEWKSNKKHPIKDVNRIYPYKYKTIYNKDKIVVRSV